MNKQHVIVGVGLVLSLAACIGAYATWRYVDGAHGEISIAEVAARPCVASAELGDRMNRIARRMAAVWYAGKSGNVELAKYEIHELEEVIEKIEVLRPIENGVDVFKVIQGVANSQLRELRASLESQKPGAFEEAYETTLQACNSCHRSAGHAFIVITKPSAPPVSNRAYHPVDTDVKVQVQAAAR